MLTTRDTTADTRSLGPAAVLLVTGQLLFIAVGMLHPSGEAANNHPAVFAEYATSTTWTTVHFGQFVAMAMIMAGIVVLFRALEPRDGRAASLERLGVMSAGITVAVYAVLQAVDGVALKQTVDAWAHGGGAQQSAAFGTAEAIRWLEWGVRSYQEVMQGATLVLLAIVVVSTARLPRGLGYLAGAAGTFYMAHGFIIGREGFSSAATHAGLLAILLDLMWVVWLAMTAQRTRSFQRGSTAR